MQIACRDHSLTVLGPPATEQIDLKGGRKGTSVGNYSVVEVTILNYQKAIVTATQCGKTNISGTQEMSRVPSSSTIFYCESYFLKNPCSPIWVAFKSHHLDTSLDKDPQQPRAQLHSSGVEYRLSQANHVAFIPFGFHDIHVIQCQSVRLEERILCALCAHVYFWAWVCSDVVIEIPLTSLQPCRLLTHPDRHTGKKELGLCSVCEPKNPRALVNWDFLYKAINHWTFFELRFLLFVVKTY